jgi:conjugative transposon TraN protein
MLYFLNNLHLRIILIGILSLLLKEAFSQVVSESRNVEVTFNKTSSIVFPTGITSVDRGSRDVLAQKAKGVSNVLQLKAGKTNFKETNLTVITADGKLHHFFVRYAETPATFTIQATESFEQNTASIPLLFQTEMTDADMKQYTSYILESPRKFSLKSKSRYDMKLALQGIYIRGNIMFYHLKISNDSNIPFHTDMLRFYVKDKQKVKRTASQEVVEVPLYHEGNNEVVPGKTTSNIVYALPKFTIPDAKVLSIELMERKGGRHLQLAIKNRTIVKALPVPEG